MPKFDAESVGDIEYDFTKWGIKDKGVVSEPSRAAVNTMMKEVQVAFKELDLAVPDDNPQAIASAMNSIEDEDIFEKMTAALVDSIAKLCGATYEESTVLDGESGAEVKVKEWSGGSPTHQSLDTLPYRVFMAFFGYIMNEVMSPEASKPGTNTSRITPLRSA